MQKIYNTLLILTVAFCSATLTYLIVGIILILSGWNPIVGDQGILQILLAVFGIAGITSAALAIRIKQSLFSGAGRRFENHQALQKHLVSRFIIAFALAEVPSILGLVYFLMSDAFLYLVIFCVISVVAFFMLRPSLDGLLDIERRAGFVS